MMIANARMYAINAITASAWQTLLDWVLRRAGVTGEVIDFPAPQPLPTLWARPELGAVFMCGYPFSRMVPQPVALAAPVPDEAAFGDRPVYWTDFIVRADAPFQRLEHTFGHRMAWTTPDSQSGYQAPRRHLSAWADRAPLFAGTVGGMVTPRRVIEAVVGGDADVGPLDSYVHALLRVTEPATAAQLRVVAATQPTPIPLLVAATATAAADIDRLREAFTDVAGAPELAAVRRTLALRRFARVEAADYDDLRKLADQTDARGYRALS